MRVTPGVLGLALSVLLFPPASASEVSRTPPPVYRGHLAAQLTPVDQVLPGRTAFPENKTGGITLLSERVFYRDGDGTTYRLLHFVYHAVDQSAVKSVSTDTFTFDRDREEIFLIDAATLLADGQRQPVEARGAFIQTPQYEASNSLYTSEAELQIVYPNVAPGATTEVIVLVRENIPVMPGQFAAVATYGGGWPTYRHRLVLDFPGDALARVRALATGAGVPEPAADPYAAGRERRAWTRERVPSVAWEENGPQWAFRAPTLWLTTLDSWDAIAAWYEKLIADRSELGPALERQVDEWTAGLADRRAIIDKLTATVANDVRYTGLEFGLAGYQPHACREVWEKRYGDCKDKANLLRAMLAHKGIAAHLAFLDTRGGGRVERASPSWQQFNHVILAVDDGPEGFLFCDPTIEHLPAGSIGLSDLAREVLIVKNGRAEWAQTPDLLAGRILVRAELALATDGGLSGWFSLGGEGADAAYYADYFNRLDSEDRLRRMQSHAEDFFPGVEAMDVDYAPAVGSVTEAVMRAYLVRPPRGAGEQTLPFPFPAAWLPAVSTNGERRFPYSTSRREEDLAVTIALPPGWTARSVPAAFSAESEVAAFAASWTAQPGKVEARLAWHPKRAVLAASEYAVFQRSVRALASWLEQPLVLAFAAGTAPAAAAAAPDAADLGDFPILPSGAGQLRLLDEKYPEGPKTPQRRAALQRVLQWFPHDAETVFDAQVKLALLDDDTDGDKAFAERLRALLTRHGGQIPASSRAWAEYLEARARWFAEKDPTAIERLRQLADDTELNAFRRGWSAEAAGRFLAETDPAAAIAFLRRHDDYDSEARENIVELIADSYAKTGDAGGFRDWAAGLVQEHPDVADALLAAGLKEIAGDEAVTVPKLGAIVAPLKGVVADVQAFPRAFPELQKLEARTTADAARQAFARRLAAWLPQHPPSWWTRERMPALTDNAAAIAFIRENNDAKKPEVVVDGVLQLVLHHEPAFADFAVYTRWAMWWLDDRHFDDALLEFLGRASLELPAAHEDVIDCWNMLGEHLARKGELDEARTVFRRVLEDPAVVKYQRVDAGGELGLMEMRAGNIDAALAAFHSFESVHTAHKWSADYLYVAVLLHLQRGEHDAALALIENIRRQEQEYLDKSDHSIVLGHLLRTASQPAALQSYWARQPRFQQAWNAVLTTHGVAPAAENAPPLEHDFTAASERVAKAVAAKDTPAYLRALDPYARIAQWVPIFGTDFIKMANKADVVSAPLQRELYRCALLLVESPEPVDPQFDATARMWEVALLIDLGQTARAAVKAQAAVADLGLDDKLGRSILRMWALAARGTPEAAEPGNRILAQLASGRELDDRLDFVRTLSDGYEIARETTAHRILLENEIGRAGFNRDSADGRVLVARLDKLLAGGEAAAAFTREVRTWIERRHLAWFDHVSPASPEDPRFATLEPAVMSTPPGFASAEIIKFNLLAALDERLSIETRAQSLYSAAYDLAFAAADAREFTAALGEVAAMTSVPDGPRANSLAFVLEGLLGAGRTENASEAATSTAFAILRDELQADFRRAHRALVRADAGGPDWETEAFAILSEQPAGRFSLSVARNLVRRLAFGGEPGRAEKLLANAKNFAVAPELRQSSSALRLEWARSVRAIRDQRVLLEDFRDRVGRLPEAKSERTPAVLNRLRLDRTADLRESERIALATLVLERGDGLPENINEVFWLVGGTPSVATTRPMFFVDILETTLRSDATDTVKGEFTYDASVASDPDRPEVLARLSSLLDEFLRSSAAASLPDTRESAAMARAIQALRTSREPRPGALFDAARTASVPSSLLARLRLRFHHTRGHAAEALQQLDAMNPDLLTSPDAFVAARAVMAAAGRDAERDLLDESMRAVLERRMPDFWMNPDEANAGLWFAVARALGARDLFTAEWFEHALAASASTVRQNSLRIKKGALNEDWNSVASAADALLQEAPFHYDFYFDRALARHHLGNDEGARADLRVFLHYCLSDGDYREALALFRALAPDEKLELPE